jgi:hypothetical protein
VFEGVIDSRWEIKINFAWRWVRFPSPAPVILIPANNLALCRGGKGGITSKKSFEGGTAGSL